MASWKGYSFCFPVLLGEQERNFNYFESLKLLVLFVIAARVSLIKHVNSSKHI